MKFKLLTCVLLVSLIAAPLFTAQAQTTEAPLLIMMNGDLWSYTEATTSLMQLTRWGYNGVPMISPDNRRVAYTSVSEIAVEALKRQGDTPNGPPQNVWVWDIQTGQSARLATQPADATFGSGLAGEHFIRRTAPAWSPDGTMLAWVEGAVTQNAGAQAVTYTLVIYDYALRGLRASVPIAPSNQARPLAAIGPQWGAAGIAVRVPIQTGSAASEVFLLYDANGTPKAEIKEAPEDGPIFDFFFASQNGQEYLTISYASGKWLLVNPVNYTTLTPQGIPELFSAGASDTVAAHFVSNASAATGSSVRWEASHGGQSVPLSFNGLPSQIAIAPSGQALAYTGDAVYILRGGQLSRIPGTERVVGNAALAFVVWGRMNWRIQAQQPVILPTVAPAVNAGGGGTTGCAGAPPTRLAVGVVARVTAFPARSNSLNSQPARPSQNPASVALRLIPVGGVFTIINGPICSDGYLWWQVNYNNVIGWTAEGEGSTYWIEPYTGPGQSACPANLPPRLVIGNQGRVAPGAPNALRSQPSKNGAVSAVIGGIPGGGVFTVRNGPICADGYAWWQVTYSGMTGWTPEGENFTYWLQPLVCGFQVPSRLIAGGKGRVTPGMPNALRSQPSKDANISAILGEIPAGGIFSVLNGPQCGDGFAWWQVNYNGKVGWTPEGQGTTYWLEPLQ